MCFLSINLCLYCTVFSSCKQDVKESKLVILFFFLISEFDVVCSVVKRGFHISQFIGDLLSGIAEGENDFRNTKDFIHR